MLRKGIAIFGIWSGFAMLSFFVSSPIVLMFVAILALIGTGIVSET